MTAERSNEGRLTEGFLHLLRAASLRETLGEVQTAETKPSLKSKHRLIKNDSFGTWVVNSG